LPHLVETIGLQTGAQRDREILPKTYRKPFDIYPRLQKD